MSQGLGIAQRRLLSSLYAAPFHQTLRWDIDYGFAEPRRPPDDNPDGEEFYLLAQLGLAEHHHPTLRDSPMRPIQSHRLGLMNWFSLNAIPSTPEERDLLRSWRALYRRAAHSLTGRGYIETVHALVDLDDLGQLWYDRDRIEECTRQAALAKVTEKGRQYVHLRRTELVTDNHPAARNLRRALRASGFLDIDEPPPLPERELPPRRARMGTPRKRTPPLAQPEPAAPPRPELGYDDAVDTLASQGFDITHVRRVIRAWHREEQQLSRELSGDSGVTLRDRQFSADEVDELSQLLAEEQSSEPQ